ncbi:hypothetical protein [Sphingomonas sp. Leaf339]|nr:hypothetical protein [Sphingomonas sp. Leaf339]
MSQHLTDPAVIAAMTDDELRNAYEQTTGEVGDEEADRLAAELNRREIDV